MDRNHTLNENIEKIQALIDGVSKLQKMSNDLTFSAILFQLDSLKTLSDETFESLESIRHIIFEQ